jgi:hypothetical protein
MTSVVPLQLGFTAWCKACGHRTDPDPAEQARWYGPDTTVPEWRRRLVCSKCGSRDVDFMVTTRQAEMQDGAAWERNRVAPKHN